MSVVDGGTLRLQVDESNKSEKSTDYPFDIPAIYLDRWVDAGHRACCLDVDEESIVVSRGNEVTAYTKQSNFDLRLEDKNGDRFWTDRWSAHDGAIVDAREAVLYKVVTYDVAAGTKKKYNVVLEEEAEMG